MNLATVNSYVILPRHSLRSRNQCLRRKSSPALLAPPTATASNSDSSIEQSEDVGKSKKHHHSRLIELSVTLTVVFSSIRNPPALAKVSEKKRPARKTESLSPEELNSWSRALPTIDDRIPYTELLDLRRDGRIKHVVKLATANLRVLPDPILVVLEDSRVLRTVLPTVERDARFWDSWDGLQMDSLCVNAFTPAIKKPEFPVPYIALVNKLLSFLPDFEGEKQKKQKKLKQRQPQRSKAAVELELARKELVELRKMERVRALEERKAMENAIKWERKMEERKRKLEARKAQYLESLRQAKKTYVNMANMWDGLARDRNIATVIGGIFFLIFYRTVVFSYRKQRKDYEDRLKIEKAEAEERKKMRELEREMGLEASTDDEADDRGGEENPYLKMAMKFMQSGARVRRVNRRLPQYMERGIDVKFSDVAGLGNIRLELEEIVKFFTLGEMYRRRGVKIPGGILLCGPPGVGKTLLAKAVASEAGVNFFSISASQFVEIYVGVGASRVRALYQEAKENAPSVVFIDELDAVGRERGLIKGSGGQERDATLNQLLVCLDGFEGRGEVITIAATNRPDILDPALVRPGRFDRKIFIPKPSLTGRVEILKVHARKKPMAEDVDYMAVSSMTEGMVGAELSNIIEVAAINMMREGRSEIGTDDLLQAAQIEERGMLDKKERSPDMWKRLALNEAAMAIVAVNFQDMKNIEFVTIAPRAGRELGYVRVKMDHMKFKEGLLTRQSLLDYITVQVAPRAADEIWHGESQLSTIWAETADNARSAARIFVLGALSDKYHGLSDFWVSDRINEIDVEALNVLNKCYTRANEILRRNRVLMGAVVDELVHKKSLSKKDFFGLVENYGCLEPAPPSILDIRASKLAQFQEMMMAKK